MFVITKGICRFHYQEVDLKKQFYSRDYTRKVLYNSNFDCIRHQQLVGRDTLNCVLAPNPPNSEELPSIWKQVKKPSSSAFSSRNFLVFLLFVSEITSPIINGTKINEWFICRDIIIDYTSRIMGIGVILFQLLAESLGWSPITW